MKTDKELLELAAKAAGIAGEYKSYYVEAYNKDFFGIAVKGASSCSFWNSLTDSGDALRLAVKLNITFVFDVDASLQDLFARAGVGLPSGVNELVINGDKDAAARRAITRVAAMIGESK